MSGGSQHNPGGRQAPLGARWSRLQVANLLARAPPAHMEERGLTWHTPTPPAHLYPVPSPPDPLAAVKAGGAVFQHAGTPPDLYRHTATPPDKHLLGHAPSPVDITVPLPPAEIYPPKDKIRPEDLLDYARGVDLSVGGRSAPLAVPSAPVAHSHAPPPSYGGVPAPALSVRDAPTINSLIARAQPRAGHARVDALLERLSAPSSPLSVIVHPRAAPTPSPPSSNEDSADSCGAPSGLKRKRKPERTIRVPTVPPPVSVPSPHNSSSSPINQPPPVENGGPVHTLAEPKQEPDQSKPSPVHVPSNPNPTEPEPPRLAPQTPQKPPSPEHPEPLTKKDTESKSETIDEIAAMVACDKPLGTPDKTSNCEPDAPVSIDSIKNILSSDTPEPPKEECENTQSVPSTVSVPIAASVPVAASVPIAESVPSAPCIPSTTSVPTTSVPSTAPVASATVTQADTLPVEAKETIDAPPRRRSTRSMNSETASAPVGTSSEAKSEELASETTSAEPAAAKFVEVEKQLENMFAGLGEEEEATENNCHENLNKPKKHRKSAPVKESAKVGRRMKRASTGDRRKGGKRSGAGKPKKQKEAVKEAYDSGSNASSSRSRGPYIQIRGPRSSPLSVSVMNATNGEDESDAANGRRKGSDEYRNGLRARGLHASTLGLRYDATTPDATWLCAFCERGPHAAGLGDLFGPYTVDADNEDNGERCESSTNEVWFHEACAVWAPGLVAAGARLWGLADAVKATRSAKCTSCARAGAGIACARHGCRARTHVPCANSANWLLEEAEFKATCPRHIA